MLLNMKISRTGKLVTAATIILLSVVIVIWVRGCRRTPSSEDNEDRLLKGYRLCSELKYEEAYGSFNVARTLAFIDGDKEKELKALKGMADCTFWVGAVDSCICLYREAVTMAHEQNKPSEEYDIYVKLKQAYMTKVDMENVLQVGQKMDSLMSVTADRKFKIDMQQRLAMEALQQQNPKLAERYLLASETFLDSLKDEERLSAMFIVYGGLRDFYFGQQNYEKARSYSKLYVEAGKNGFRQQQMAYMTYDTEAIICAQQKDRKAAFAALDSMEYGLTLKMGASEVNVMHYHDVKGRVHALFEEWEKACEEYKNALAAVDNTHATYRADYFRIVGLLGVALYHCKRYDEARGYLADFSLYCKQQYGEESLAFADALWTMANFEGYCGETDAGKQYYVRSVDMCKRLVAEQLRYISVQERNAFWLSFAPKMWAMTAYGVKIGEECSEFTEKCYEALLFSKALLLESDRTMAMAIRSECTKEEQRVYDEMQSLQNQLKGLMNDYEKNKERIGKLHERISRQNQKLTPIVSKLDYTSFLSQNYEDIKQSMKDDEVLLDFTDYASDERVQQLTAFIVERQQSHPRLVKAFTEEKIKSLLAGKPIDFLYKEPYASKAVGLIWEPFANALKGKRTIYYVPSGILHRIALESLLMRDGTLLGDHFRFVRLTSAREIAKTKENPKTIGTTATLYGALKYDVDTMSMAQEASRYQVVPLFAFNRGETVKGGGRYRELANAKEEIAEIEAILKRRRLKVIAHTGAKGTEESFLALNGKAPNILHIATHGFYYTPEQAKSVSCLNGYSDAMSLSGLIMAGGNRAWTGQKVPQGVRGGVLTANTIAALDLRKTDLLVLSACQTGLGLATPEGLYGLQRAFKKAGVQTMVMTLWNINDKVAKDFMIKFYEELADGKNNWDKRKAFENAQKYIRGLERYKDPYYWAGFVMLD
jgi:CHAT domain-containing protein